MKVYSLADIRDDASVPLGVSDIWPRLRPILMSLLGVSQNEPGVRESQLKIAHEVALLMPSPHHDGSDRSNASFYHHARFFYRFSSTEEYYWVTSVLARGYCFSSICFPAREIVIHLFPDTDPPELFTSFLTQWETAQRHGKPAEASLIVSGFPHPMHVLWNELPALTRAAADTALGANLQVAFLFEPFGPAVELFPEFAGRIRRVNMAEVRDLNRGTDLLVGLGSRVISAETQRRVRAVAGRHATTETIQSREEFRKAHNPILWLSVKPPKRTPQDQVGFLARVIERFYTSYPEAGFIVDGASLPWDYGRDNAYPDWYRNVMNTAISGSSELIEALLQQLDSSLRRHVVCLNNISILDEVAWGEAANFYFCHGGTMQNKIGWVHRIPGMLHSNSRFMASYRNMFSPVENAPFCICLSEQLVIDDDPTKYSMTDLARKDQNYTIVSPDAAAEELIAAFRKHNPIL